jgi:hypothetical protein
MLWWLVSGCFVITDREIRVHDAGIRPAPDEPEEVRLTVVGDRLQGLNGVGVRAVVVLNGEVVSSGEDTIAERRFAIEFPDGLEPGVNHRVDVLIDGDGDGVCAPVDTGWSWGGSGWGGSTTWTTTTTFVDELFRVRGVSANAPGPLEVELDRDADANDAACGSFADPA